MEGDNDGRRQTTSRSVESPLTRFCGRSTGVCEVADPTPNVVPANYELQAKQAAAAAIDRLDVSG